MQALSMNQLVLFEAYHKDSRYERFQRLQVLSGARASIPFQGFDLAQGGVQRTLTSARYTLLVDGIERAAVSVPAGTRSASFDLDLQNVPSGWRKLEIGGLGSGETCPTWFAFVRNGTVGEQPYTPVTRGTYELTQSGNATHVWALAPGRYNPTPRPLAPRAAVPFDTTLPRSEMHCTQLVPLRFGDVHRPNRNADGILSSFDKQPYHWADMVAVKPTVACLDGPRGVGTVCMTTHLEVGRGPNGNIIFCDPWRVGTIAPDGTVKTLAGYRHRGILNQWADGADVELVGDWSAIPAERRGFHEIWGLAWDERTLAVNTAAAPIPTEGNQQPHITGPVCFIADTQNNRVCKLEFSPVSRSVPPRVTEFLTGIQDPWDVVFHDGVLYVSERKSHRICAYDATTGARLRTVVQGTALAYVDRNRDVIRTASVVDCQAQPCVAPEGLYQLDDWLYFGSKAQAQIRRVHLVTGEVQVVGPVQMDGNSKFVKFAVSDGTFGPRGSVFFASWSNAWYGYAGGYAPGPTSWKWFEQLGGAGSWQGFVYVTAVAVGQGRLVIGGANEGVLLITRRQAGDVVPSAAVTRGAAEYRSRGLNLLHGEYGFGFYGLRLPWGVSSDIDAFLMHQGHAYGA
jgi:hypothetical protein